MLSFLKKTAPASSVVPSTISLDIAPDAGPITHLDHVQLDPSYRAIPILFWVLLSGLSAFYVVTKANTRAYENTAMDAKARAKTISATIDTVKKETAAVKTEVDLATNIADWTEVGTMLQPFIVQIATICDTRVQINELSITRDDLKSARYAFSLSCMGDVRNFEKLEADLVALFKSRGWRPVPVLNTSEGSRLTLKYYLIKDVGQS